MKKRNAFKAKYIRYTRIFYHSLAYIFTKNKAHLYEVGRYVHMKTFSDI